MAFVVRAPAEPAGDLTTFLGPLARLEVRQKGEGADGEKLEQGGIGSHLSYHRRAVAQHCINGGCLSQWGMPKFDPP